MKKFLVIIVILMAAFVTACGNNDAKQKSRESASSTVEESSVTEEESDTPEPTEAPTPEPTPVPWEGHTLIDPPSNMFDEWLWKEFCKLDYINLPWEYEYCYLDDYNVYRGLWKADDIYMMITYNSKLMQILIVKDPDKPEIAEYNRSSLAPECWVEPGAEETEAPGTEEQITSPVPENMYNEELWAQYGEDMQDMTSYPWACMQSMEKDGGWYGEFTYDGKRLVIVYQPNYMSITITVDATGERLYQKDSTSIEYWVDDWDPYNLYGE